MEGDLGDWGDGHPKFEVVKHVIETRKYLRNML